MVDQQQNLVLSSYMKIYELVVPKNNLLRQIKEFVNFGFIYDELIDKYCLDKDVMQFHLSACLNICC